MSDFDFMIPSLEMHRRALKDIGLELSASADVIDRVASGSTGAVATMSGALAAQSAPDELDHRDLESALRHFAETYAEAWEISFSVDEAGADLTFGDCAIRDICSEAGVEPGGKLCALFHGFMVGYLHQLTEGMKQGRFDIRSAGDECRIRIDVE
jgi:hypothetical protein